MQQKTCINQTTYNKCHLSDVFVLKFLSELICDTSYVKLRFLGTAHRTDLIYHIHVNGVEPRDFNIHKLLLAQKILLHDALI